MSCCVHGNWSLLIMLLNLKTNWWLTSFFSYNYGLYIWRFPYLPNRQYDWLYSGAGKKKMVRKILLKLIRKSMYYKLKRNLLLVHAQIMELSYWRRKKKQKHVCYSFAICKDGVSNLGWNIIMEGELSYKLYLWLAASKRPKRGCWVLFLGLWTDSNIWKHSTLKMPL